MRKLFFSIGLLFITGVVFSVFTYRVYNQNIYELIVEIEEDLLDIPRFVQQQEMLELAPPRPRIHNSLEIEIADDVISVKKEVSK